MHDANFIGWWWWIGVIPYIGSILLPLLLFHPTVEKEVKWNTYLFEETVRYENSIGSLKEEFENRRRQLAAKAHLKGVINDPELNPPSVPSNSRKRSKMEYLLI